MKYFYLGGYGGLDDDDGIVDDGIVDGGREDDNMLQICPATGSYLERFSSTYSFKKYLSSKLEGTSVACLLRSMDELGTNTKVARSSELSVLLRVCEIMTVTL